MSPLYVTGYDGSQAAHAAVTFAHGLADATGAEVLAVNVYDAAPEVAPHHRAMPGADAVQDDVRRTADRVIRGLAEPGVRRGIFPARSVPEGLHHLAEQKEAALIVVGRTHRAALVRRTRGGVAERLMHGAPCPVAVVPAEDGRELRTIAVAYDGTPAAESALQFATGLARTTRAQLLLARVVEPGPFAHPEVSPDLWRSVWLRRSESLESTTSMLRADGLAVTSRLLEGDAAEQLAALDDVELLVIGSRGFGPLHATVAGSVSSRVAERAAVPVMVVPRGIALSRDDDVELLRDEAVAP